MSEDILVLTAQIVSSHVTKNPVPAGELPTLIREVFNTLSSVGKVSTGEEPLKPAVPINKSVFPDYIICLEDGKKNEDTKASFDERLQSHD
jgi:MucR family transcriptional regulator, transcriptional regulator of exopolysaccharide biosynthesis